MVNLDDILRNAADDMHGDYLNLKRQFETETQPNELLSVLASSENQWVHDIAC